MRIWLTLSIMMMMLTSCQPSQPEQVKAIKRPGLKTLYVSTENVNSHDEDIIFRTALELINDLRAMHGRTSLVYNDALNAAAKKHAQDIRKQGRAWHFSSDGLSPIDRARYAGYQGILLGEAVSETYENIKDTVYEWIKETSTRNALLAPNAQELGLGYIQEELGKVWWVLVLGGTGERHPISFIPEFSSLNEYLSLDLEEKQAYIEHRRNLSLGIVPTISSQQEE